MAKKSTEKSKPAKVSAKPEKLRDLDVALHHHSTQSEKKSKAGSSHPFRPAGFVLMLSGLVLLCLCCIWWAVSGRIAITSKQNFEELTLAAQYPNAVASCKYLRPALVNTYVGPDSYLYNNMRWQPTNGPLKNGQLAFETCSYRLDKPDLQARIDLYSFVDKTYAEAAWEKIKNTTGAVKLPLDTAGRESVNTDTNTRYILSHNMIVSLYYGPVSKKSASFLTPVMVNDFMRDAITGIDKFIQQRAH